MTATTRRTFTAQFNSTCTSCGAAILSGDLIFYAPGHENASGLDCCGEREDADLLVTQRPDEGLAVDDEDPVEAIARVMPRNRTARDACGVCWLIPAANGTCGCDSPAA